MSNLSNIQFLRFRTSKEIREQSQVQSTLMVHPRKFAGHRGDDFLRSSEKASDSEETHEGTFRFSKGTTIIDTTLLFPLLPL